MAEQRGKFEIRWFDRGGPPQQPPNPDYPFGCHVDLTEAAQRADKVGMAIEQGIGDYVREAKGVLGFPFKADVRITLVPVEGSGEQPIEVEVGLLDRMLKDVGG